MLENLFFSKHVQSSKVFEPYGTKGFQQKSVFFSILNYNQDLQFTSVELIAKRDK
jgi:hypothetical protein